MADVGADKPVGYLPLYTIEAMGEAGQLLCEDAASRGLVVASFRPEVCCIKSGALYVYDREALSLLLEQDADALSAAGMTSDPDRFIAEIATRWLDVSHPLTPLIAEAFGEKRQHLLNNAKPTRSNHGSLASSVIFTLSSGRRSFRLGRRNSADVRGGYFLSCASTDFRSSMFA